MKEMVATYGGSSAAVSSDDASDLAWLREFLSPAFEFGEAGSSSRFILQSDTRAVEAGRRMSLTTRGQVTAFILDSGVEKLPCQQDSAQEVVAYDRVFDAVYRKVGETTLVLDVPSPGPGRRARGGWMRAIREGAMDHAWLAGGSFFHAAAFVVEGSTVVVAGDKGAGKSTMLCAALLGLRGAEFLANDRLTLHRSGGMLRARALPSIVSIRAGSLGVVPGLAERFSGMTQDYTGAPLSRESLALRRTMAPSQFACALGASMTREAHVGCILFPVIDPQEPDFRVRRLTEIESAQRVLQSAFARHSLGIRSELFAAPDHSGVFPTADQLLSRLSQATSGTPCFEAAVGPGLYQERDGMQRLIDTIFSRL
jgi:hypothetical protein